MGTHLRLDVFRVSTPTSLFITDCPTCGIIFGIPESLEDRRREDHGAFYCPNGHSMVFNQETEAEKLKRELKEARSRLERTTQLATDRYDQLQHEKRRSAARKGVVTRMTNRAVAGACVFGCRRNFANLQRHVAAKHPDHVVEPTTE